MFVKIPNRFFDKELKHKDKIILIWWYLNINTNRFGQSLFELEDLIRKCGLVPKSGKDESGNDKTINQFKDILSDLEKLKIVNIEYTTKEEKV